MKTKASVRITISCSLYETCKKLIASIGSASSNGLLLAASLSKLGGRAGGCSVERMPQANGFEDGGRRSVLCDGREGSSTMTSGPFRYFNREEWALLRSNTPLSLS